MTSVSLTCKHMICRIKKTPRVLCFGLLCFGLIGGCGERISEHGHTITQVELETIEIGMSKRADVLDMANNNPEAMAHVILDWLDQKEEAPKE